MTFGDRRGSARVVREEVTELGAELIRRPSRAELRLELLERRDERLGDEAPPELTEPTEARRLAARARVAAPTRSPRFGVATTRRPSSRRDCCPSGRADGSPRPGARRRARGVDEALQLARVLAARGRLDPRADVDTPRPDLGDRIRDVVVVQTAGEQQPDPTGRTFGERPVEDASRARFGVVDEHDVGGAVRRGRERRIPGRERLDHERNPLTDPPDLGDRLTAVQLGPSQAGRVHDLGDSLGPFVAEHPDGDRLEREPLDDVGRHRGLHHPPAPRREDETDRVGTERHREQRVVLVGDPAHLDEHGPPTVSDHPTTLCDHSPTNPASCVTSIASLGGS